MIDVSKFVYIVVPPLTLSPALKSSSRAGHGGPNDPQDQSDGQLDQSQELKDQTTGSVQSSDSEFY